MKFYQWSFLATSDFIPLILYEKESMTYLAREGVRESKTLDTEVD
jgi:hypothetical protein